ncbi:MAG: TIGR02186 family protein, partial [Pseudomonadota bacterium]
MAGLRALAAIASLSLLFALSPATAQTPPAEGIQIGLSTDAVSITAGFSGADLTIFGSLENPDPLVARQGRYDVIVVLEGPPRPVVVRRKDRVLGVWINLQSETFENVPMSYSVATTRPLQDITEPAKYKQLSLGAQNLYMKPSDETDSPTTIEEFTAALRERKAAAGLYSENVGGVQ